MRNGTARKALHQAERNGPFRLGSLMASDRLAREEKKAGQPWPCMAPDQNALTINLLRTMIEPSAFMFHSVMKDLGDSTIGETVIHKMNNR